MKFETRNINFFAGCLQIPIPVALIALAGELQQAANSGKILEVEIKIKRKRRSLNANAYLWELLGRMAAVLKTDKDSVYPVSYTHLDVYKRQLLFSLIYLAASARANLWATP